MFLAKVYVTYKESILDPKGEAIRKSIQQMDYDSVQSVRLGKYFEIVVEATDEEVASREIEEIADKLLANVVMETYRYELQPITASEASTIQVEKAQLSEEDGDEG